MMHKGRLKTVVRILGSLLDSILKDSVDFLESTLTLCLFVG